MNYRFGKYNVIANFDQNGKKPSGDMVIKKQALFQFAKLVENKRNQNMKKQVIKEIPSQNHIIQQHNQQFLSLVNDRSLEDTPEKQLDQIKGNFISVKNYTSIDEKHKVTFKPVSSLLPQKLQTQPNPDVTKTDQINLSSLNQVMKTDQVRLGSKPFSIQDSVVFQNKILSDQKIGHIEVIDLAAKEQRQTMKESIFIQSIGKKDTCSPSMNTSSHLEDQINKNDQGVNTSLFSIQPINQSRNVNSQPILEHTSQRLSKLENFNQIARDANKENLSALNQPYNLGSGNEEGIIKNFSGRYAELYQGKFSSSMDSIRKQSNDPESLNQKQKLTPIKYLKQKWMINENDREKTKNFSYLETFTDFQTALKFARPLQKSGGKKTSFDYNQNQLKLYDHQQRSHTSLDQQNSHVKSNRKYNHCEFQGRNSITIGTSTEENFHQNLKSSTIEGNARLSHTSFNKFDTEIRKDVLNELYNSFLRDQSIIGKQTKNLKSQIELRSQEDSRKISKSVIQHHSQDRFSPDRFDSKSQVSNIEIVFNIGQRKEMVKNSKINKLFSLQNSKYVIKTQGSYQNPQKQKYLKQIYDLYQQKILKLKTENQTEENINYTTLQHYYDTQYQPKLNQDTNSMQNLEILNNSQNQVESEEPLVSVKPPSSNNNNINNNRELTINNTEHLDAWDNQISEQYDIKTRTSQTSN